MNRRALFGLGIVFVLLLGVVVLQSQGVFTRLSTPPTSTPNPLVQESVFGGAFTVQDITAIRLGSPSVEQDLLLVRQGEGIWNAPDYDGTVDGETARLIAQTLVILPYSETVPMTDDTSLGAFGLAENNVGALTVEILLRDETAHALFFGGLTPLQDGYYTLVDEHDDVYVVDPRAVEFLRVQLRNPPINLTTE